MAEIEKRIEWAIPSPRKLFTPAVTVILVLMVIGWTLIIYAHGFTVNYLALSLPGILHGRIWQLVTYPFINSCGLSMVFDGLLVLFIGSAIEREWRTGAFILLWLIVSAACGLIWIAVFGLLYYRRRFFAFFWPVEAQYIAWMLIVIGIILGIPQPITWIWVSGALVAYIYVKLRWRAVSVSNMSPAGRYKPGNFVDID